MNYGKPAIFRYGTTTPREPRRHGPGDFPNQVNNSICFPGILKGALLVRARKITDGMAVRCAHSIAEFSEKRGVSLDNIIVSMEETDVFAHEAADVARKGLPGSPFPGMRSMPGPKRTSRRPALWPGT